MRKFLTVLAMLIFYSVLATAQTRTVSGKVTDQQGQPVPFATVRVKGSNQGTSADADGAFTIKAKAGDVLQISGTGFNAVSFNVTDASTLQTIKVSRKETGLTEVVVTALGIAKQAKSLGYSTEKIGGKDLNTAQPISVANGLTGKVSGLEISTVNNGLFAPTRITLRGNRSLIGNNQPLIVVDGAIFYNDITTLNPADIESINILKGSSASAIYGSDASNGVMVVTTKHGTPGKTTLTYSTTTQFETVDYLPSYQTEFGNNGGEFYTYNYNNLSSYVPWENQAYGPAYNGAMVPYGRPLSFDGTESLQMIPYSAVKNQKKDFFNTGITEQNGLTYSGGDDRSRYYLSAQDISSKNPMPGDHGRRDVFRFGGAKTYGMFTADYSVSYTYTYKNTTNTGAVYEDLLNVPSNVPEKALKSTTNSWGSLDGYFNDYFYSPLWIAQNIRNIYTDNGLQGNVHLGLKPLKWLNLSYRLGANYTGEKYEYQQAAAAYDQHSLTDDSAYISNPDGTGVVLTTGYGSKWIAQNNSYLQPSYQTYQATNFLLTSDFVASAQTKFADKFEVNGSVGTSYIDNQINFLGVNANNIFFPVYNITSLTGIPTLSQTTAEARKLGFFGDATIGYDELLYLHGSYRTDIDSRLSKENRWIPYYDVDASLIVSDMIPSMKSSNTFDYFKVRAAYSVTGNATALASGQPYLAAGAYQTTQTLQSVPGFPFSGLGGFSLSTNLANPNIKPEQVKEEEVGAEFGFLQHDRITFGADIYDQKLSNGIVKASLPYSSGYATALVNAANTDNRGVELDLKGNIIQNKDWTLSAKVNYTYNRTMVKSINGGVNSLNISSAAGYNYTGNLNAGNGNAYAVVNNLFPVIEGNDWVRDPQGQVIVNAVTGLPSVGSNLVVLGNATPKDLVGITGTLSYKSLSLTATADYRGGYKTYNSIGQYMAFTGISSYTTQSQRQRFIFPNSVIDAGNGKYIPNTNVEVNDANFNLWPGLFNNVASPWVQSASFWKVREIALSYQIPVQSFFGGQKLVKAATFTVSSRNVFMFRPKTNQWTDPEYSEDTSNAVGENSVNQAPPTRIWGANLNVTF
jgi:TonB-linked SusC/RagA family outer membrane protein